MECLGYTIISSFFFFKKSNNSVMENQNSGFQLGNAQVRKLWFHSRWSLKWAIIVCKLQNPPRLFKKQLFRRATTNNNQTVKEQTCKNQRLCCTHTIYIPFHSPSRVKPVIRERKQTNSKLRSNSSKQLNLHASIPRK